MDYLPALLGGVLIGLAATLLLFTNGKIAGISGIVSDAVGSGADRAFVGGLLIAGLCFALFRPAVFGETVAPIGMIAVAGLLVGFGTRLGNGCTSGHGVCGLARLSPRSLVATLTFMLTAGLTVLAVRA